MKFYEFIDRAGAIPKLVFIEGTERVFADRAEAQIVERLLEPAERDLNVDRIDATESEAPGRIASAVAALPFLAATRLVIAKRVHEMRAQPRRDLLAVTQSVPDGNVLVIEDLLSPSSKRPEPMSKGAGRAALRIDTSPGIDARTRFVEETLASLGAKAERGAVATLAQSDADLLAVRTDLEKLALLERKITLEDLLRESLVTSDAKAYRFASLLVEGRRAEALALAWDMFANDPRGAAIPLVSALATEYLSLWELARPGGVLPARQRWRERVLRPVAAALGERRARAGYERAVRGFEALVTGRADDARAVIAALATATEG